MPTPIEILLANGASTRFKNITVDLRLSTSDPQPDSKTLHLLSRWDPTNGTFKVMGRIKGNPYEIPFLIHQQLNQPLAKIGMWTAIAGHLSHRAFIAWDSLPLTEVRYVDQVIVPLAAFTATESPAGTLPQGPGLVPTAACWLIDLHMLPPGFGGPGPDLVRLWIEQPLTKALDHRIEQYRGNDLVRVIVSEGWVAAGPDGPWGAAKRTFIDVQSGRSTMVTIQSQPDLSQLAPSRFDIGNFISGLW